MVGSAPHGNKEPDAGQRAALRRDLVSRSAGFVSWKTITGALGVLASMLLYRALGPDQAGRLQLVLALGMTLGAMGGLGFYETLARFVPVRGPEAGAGLFRRALRWNLGAFLGGAAVYFGVSAMGWGVPPEVRRVSALFLAFTAAYGFTTTAMGMLRGQGRFHLIPRLELGSNFGAKLLSLGLVLLVPGFATAVGAHAAAQVFVLVAALVLLRGELRGPATPFHPEEVRYGRLMLGALVVQLLVSTVDLYVLRVLMGPEEVGLYAAGYRIPLLAEQLVLGPVGVPLLYYFSHPEYAHLKPGVVRRGTRLTAALLGFAALVLAAAASPVILLLLGDAYRESIPITRIYAAHPLGVGLLLFSLPLYGSVSRPEFGIVQGLVTFGLNLVLDLILVPLYGPVGAAVAGVIAVVVTAVGASVFLYRRFAMDIRATVFGVIALYGVCFALLELGWPWLALPLYPLALWPLRLLRREDLALLRRGELRG
jgi:O-antigen/teichoic acid export membrane protein